MALDDPRPVASQDFDPDALQARYGKAAPNGLLWNDTIAQLLAHRSVRAYRTDPLPVGTVPTLVAAAQSAANSSNLQLWSVVAVTDQDQREKLADLAGGQAHIRTAPLILLWIADLARGHLIAADAGEPVEGLSYLESWTVAAVDAALAAQNATIAAESLGLGTVYIGALRNKPVEVAAVAGLPPHAAIVFGLVVGWPDETRPATVKPRLSQSAILHENSYALEAQREAIADYDATARDFQRSQGQDPVGWVSQILNRSRSGAALNGRDRLRQALNALGFPLK
ncbi:MAG: nitroreductase family protein [Sphingobium sp.]